MSWHEARRPRGDLFYFHDGTGEERDTPPDSPFSAAPPPDSDDSGLEDEDEDEAAAPAAAPRARRPAPRRAAAHAPPLPAPRRAAHAPPPPPPPLSPPLPPPLSWGQQETPDPSPSPPIRPLAGPRFFTPRALLHDVGTQFAVSLEASQHGGARDVDAGDHLPRWGLAEHSRGRGLVLRRVLNADEDARGASDGIDECLLELSCRMGRIDAIDLERDGTVGGVASRPAPFGASSVLRHTSLSAHLPAVLHLRLSGLGMTRVDVPLSMVLPRLETVDLSNNALKQCPKLPATVRVVDLSHNNIRSAAHLEPLFILRSLDLTGNCFSSFAALRPLCLSSASLRNLSLHGNGIVHEIAASLVERQVVALFPNLETLDGKPLGGGAASRATTRQSSSARQTPSSGGGTSFSGAATLPGHSRPHKSAADGAVFHRLYRDRDTREESAAALRNAHARREAADLLLHRANKDRLAQTQRAASSHPLPRRRRRGRRSPPRQAHIQQHYDAAPARPRSADITSSPLRHPAATAQEVPPYAESPPMHPVAAAVDSSVLALADLIETAVRTEKNEKRPTMTADAVLEMAAASGIISSSEAAVVLGALSSPSATPTKPAPSNKPRTTPSRPSLLTHALASSGLSVDAIRSLEDQGYSPTDLMTVEAHNVDRLGLGQDDALLLSTWLAELAGDDGGTPDPDAGTAAPEVATDDTPSSLDQSHPKSTAWVTERLADVERALAVHTAAATSLEGERMVLVAWLERGPAGA